MAEPCACGCGEMTTVTQAKQPCGCGCECCGGGKPKEVELVELEHLREAVEKRLAEVRAGAR